MQIIILILNHILFLIKIKANLFLPLMRTTQFQNTIFCSGPKLYTKIMFGNIIKNDSINNRNKLKKAIYKLLLDKYI